ncbi:MAG: magnesium/cobalt transporter CorA [Saprospiraceae bacterium]|nr:magnesium/cobalt transporter CorA [Candidatus Vicinibacter affinis]MBP6173062.1 magnesium/cobalt transporter CorA [Saprospiraceae bacterium]MBK6571006.1 magnesium/cobalt transporter CorA [Candidatus Vicinibacter affinis]MBK6822665.1 magnesium/cobalt transporter CorA [Candidatus Vicinibacter affinis]MBK7303717.1 magnesium/cobalt transporter CorA [Candidatus Vicinibacter affinis]
MSKRKKTGLSPGTLIFERNQTLDEPIGQFISYNLSGMSELKVSDVWKFTPSKDQNLWVDVMGIHDSEYILKIGDAFNIHRLILEDIQELSQRTKIDSYENGVFSIVQNLKFDPSNKTINKEQISIFFAEHVLVSFQENPDDSFAIIRKRMGSEISRIRSKNSDYLFYALMDYLVDCYFLVTDAIDLEIANLEERIHQKPGEDIILDIFTIRGALLKFRKYIYPLRDEIGKLKRSETQFLQESNMIFFRDLEDHIIQIIEIIDNQRELLNGMKDLALNQTSLALNKDMKWLAAISTISIPILFMTGVYGMNFEFMPELKWKYGYLVWWITIAFFVVSLIVYFKRKRII